MNHETQELVDFSEEELQEIKLVIEEWKDQYGSIYMTEFDDDSTFVWRTLSKREFERAMDYYEDPFERAEYVCRLCVLDPDPKDVDWSLDLVAGIPEVLTENILRESGFSSGSDKVSELLEKYEAQMQTFDNQMPCIIAEAFNGLNIEEIESWPIDKIVRYYSRAKWIIETLRGIDLVREESQGVAAPDGTAVKGDPGDFPELAGR